MKTLISTPKTLVTVLSVATLVGLLALPLTASAQVKGAGAAKLAVPAATTVSPSALAVEHSGKPGMGCNSCQTTLVAVNARPAKTGATAETKLVARNNCPDCVNTIVTKGTGRLAKDVVVHACKKCAAEDAVCCAGK